MLAPLLALLFAQAKPELCTAGCHTDEAQRPGHAALAAAHPLSGAAAPRQLSCTACHRGDPQARDQAAAHKAEGMGALLPRALTTAACGACHLPGAVAGTASLARGSAAFQELACAYCHPGRSGAVGPAPLAPPLGTIGIRGPKYLRQVVEHPASVFPGSIMPSYAPLFEAQPEREQELLIYLLAMTPELPPGPATAGQRCASCHSSPRKPTGPKHRCTLLIEEAAELSCARCHPKKLPPGEGECLYVAQRRLSCGACHEGELHGP